MRIVIDLQAAQTESRRRGIGRYAMATTSALCRKNTSHEIFVALSGLFPESIPELREALSPLLPPKNIRVWHAPPSINTPNSPEHNQWRAQTELLREAFLISLAPDVIHIFSLFEGFSDPAAASIGRIASSIPTTITIYDLIPKTHSKEYLSPNPALKAWYDRQSNFITKASQLFSISDTTTEELHEHFPSIKERVRNVGTGYERIRVDDEKHDLTNQPTLIGLLDPTPFILYSGGADVRKNLPRLIEAFAGLPVNLRRTLKLVFAGSIPTGDTLRLKAQFEEHIPDEEHANLVFTGYVSDETLAWLYRNCALFVFPSWAEGFGIPPLEAMAQGAVVIGSNISNTPAILDFEEALFDPFDISSIATKIIQALEDSDFRERFKEHAKKRITQFSWDDTAGEMISAWEHFEERSGHNGERLSAQVYGQLIATLRPGVSPIAKASDQSLKLARSIAQNQANSTERQLFVDISEFCRHDAGTGVQRVTRHYLYWLLKEAPKGFHVEPVYASVDQPYRYARAFTADFLNKEYGEEDDVIHWQRGDIFFGLDLQHHVQAAHVDFFNRLRQDGVTVKFLIHDLLPIQYPSYFYDSTLPDNHEQLMNMIAGCDGAVCVSHATANAFRRWRAHNKVEPNPSFQLTSVHNGADFSAHDGLSDSTNEDAAPISFPRDRPTFLCVSTIEPRKKQDQILEAFEILWRDGINANLVFVGRAGWKTDALTKTIESHKEFNGQLFWHAGISDELLATIYKKSSCLIAASLNEGFGLSLIEAARYGLPILARDIEVFREIAGDNAHYFTGETGEELAQAVQAWLATYKQGAVTSSTDIKVSTWQESAKKLAHALVSESYAPQQILVDVSELVTKDAATGIQRVVKNVLTHWLKTPPKGYRIEPVYASVDGPYRYARTFTARFLGVNKGNPVDDPIDYAPGDIFFGLDLQPLVQTAHRELYQAMRDNGVYVSFLVYDLIPILSPEYFDEGTEGSFRNWISTVQEANGAVCISRAVAAELERHLALSERASKANFCIDWNHLGSDFPALASSPERESDQILLGFERLWTRPTFLMTGTIEPRKAHKEIVDAFCELWDSGVNVNLLLIGKPGWKTESLQRAIKNSPHFNKRLFWLTDADDAQLADAYKRCCALIAASHAEGFGLPLVEAARYGLPIIARDIPVFREIAGKHAFYFEGSNPSQLAATIRNWLDLYNKVSHPKSDLMPVLSWEESADRLLTKLCENATAFA